MQKLVSQLKTICRSLYENYLEGEKQKYITIVNEAWIYLCN